MIPAVADCGNRWATLFAPDLSPKELAMAAVKNEQTVQAWGNDLGVMITPSVADAAKFSPGLRVTVEVVDGGLLVRRAAIKPRMTLAAKLQAFDPAVHGGEAMAGARSKCTLYLLQRAADSRK